MRTPEPPADPIELLEDQHQHIRSLMSLVSMAETEVVRERAFDQLRELIAAHERAEQTEIRPVTREVLPDGEDVAEGRIAEENDAKSALVELERLSIDDPGFAERFAAFRAAIEEHARHEEQLEFPALREHLPAQRLAELAERLQRAESGARDGRMTAKPPAVNAVLSPFVAIADRIRDALAS
ncbi:MAG TPA: hemerythrin domain-containing protein [Mycobacteriales bacterium]|nr:hemerythrin domain-containing protein [Mycobacteriales bacterium]